MLFILVHSGVSVEVYSDDKNTFRGKFFLDPPMKTAFEPYHEIAIMDATVLFRSCLILGYLHILLSVKIQMVKIKSPVDVCLMVSEDANSISEWYKL